MSRKTRKNQVPPRKSKQNVTASRVHTNEEQRGVVSAQLTTEESFSGPLPSPRTLFQYEQHLPGLADRIVAMAERESQHRHEMESSALKGDIALSRMAHAERRLGQIFGFLLSLAAIGGGVVLAVKDIAGWGAVLSLSGVAALAAVFVFSANKEKTKN